MLFYIILFFVCVVAMLLNNRIITNEKNRKKIEISILCILCIMAGTRYNTGGSDYFVYKTIFDSVPLLSNFDFSTVHDIYGTFDAEVGYLYINSVFKTIGLTFYGFTLIHSIFFYSCMYKGLKKYISNFNMLIIVFLYKMFFYNTFISMRQSIAIAIFFIALKYIEEKKIYKYLLLCIIAFTIHESAIIMVPIYFITNWNCTKKQIIILNCIFLPTLLFSILGIPILDNFSFLLDLFSNSDKAISLFYGSGTESISVFHTLEYFAIMIVLLFNYDELIKVNKNSKFIISLFMVMLPLFTMFRGYEILTRMKDYFTLTYAIILWYACNIDNFKNAFLIQCSTILICAFGFFRFIILFDNGHFLDYQSYILRDVNIIEIWKED